MGAITPNGFLLPHLDAHAPTLTLRFNLHFLIHAGVHVGECGEG